MELTPKTARTVIEAYVDAGTPVMLAGQPGIGKSDVIAQIAQDRAEPMKDVRLVTVDPVDMRGLPAARGDRAVFLPTSLLPHEDVDGASGFLFFDELDKAPAMTQSAALELIWNRRVGDYVMPDGWKIIAAVNRTQDRAGSQRLNSALANRFAHVEMVADVDAWCQWALRNGVAAEAVAFIRFRPELLNNFEPDRKVNATPRTWAMAAPHIGKHAPDIEAAVLTGTIGEGPAAELLAFLRIWRNLPSPDAILMNPQSGDVPTDGATLYALAGALARKVGPNTMGNFVTYLSRMPAEYGVVAMKDATQRDESLMKTAPAIQWFSDNSDVYL